ncbi:hypothetical protein [Rubrivivax benzoatilyticus]|uniref:Uncharacterized protein n=1 Tax=Rubrivivax benzoatilyticus TaxID=316997 RepID=A0ABX0HV91_9BURK|nr:hypothetical protein [Rubrivivax benzoatilyticus]EGJ09776.1 hypothetical protein RBXJA2T_05573 [Rubrivivax benzoatilyticus JA2 = ATCC BAA-35]NHK97453.1 hypothetical protein [Rubrivivax benzoatilyticus]NHL22852.1 hypothetical protein [Rubrivivax benzoatilyticus]
MTAPVHFVCVTIGRMDGMAELYLSRLHGMLQRHVHRPFTLHCFSDVARQVPPGVVLHDCSEWRRFVGPSDHVTCHKLCLFAPELVGLAEFFYLDLSIVVQQDLDDWLARSLGRAEDLLIVDDWNYDCYNSSVMRIRPGAMRAVFDDFAAGVRHPARVPGDQDQIHAAVAAHGLSARVGLFDAADIVSYKTLRRLGRRRPGEAKRAFAGALIVKFHGRPKPHVALSWPYHLLRVVLPQLPLGGAGYLPWRRLRREWNGR